MATWITHLRVAEKVGGLLKIPSLPYFFIGNVAPDSGKLNDDRLTYSPPSYQSHFEDKSIGRWLSLDMSFYKAYYSISKKSDEHKSFYFGYFFHLLTDILWRHLIHKPTKIKFADDYKDPKFIWTVKRDWYGIDFEYLNENKNWPVWITFLESNYEIDVLDFYDQSNIQNKLTEIKNFYSGECPFDRPGIYLKNHNIDRFTEICAELLMNVFKKLNVNINNKINSAFELIEDDYHFLKFNHFDINKL